MFRQRSINAPTATIILDPAINFCYLLFTLKKDLINKKLRKYYFDTKYFVATYILDK